MPFRRSGMVVSHVPVSLTQSILFWVAGLEAAKIWFDLCSLAATQFSRTSLRCQVTCGAWRLASSPVRSQSNCTSKPVQALEAAKQPGADWTGCGRTQACLVDGKRQLALTFRFRRLQQSREEDRSNGLLYRLKRRPIVGQDALEVLPLLLE
jgi:hypothetical protein